MSDWEFVNGAGEVLAFPGPRFTIGAGADCELRFLPNQVQGRHALVTVTPQGPMVSDLTGRSLTWIDGKVVREALLPPGSTLRCGRLELTLRRRAAPPPRPPPGRPGPVPGAPGPAERATERLPAADVRRTAFGPGVVIDGRYRVVAKLAEGGMGEVYRAEHVELGKPLALKVMLRELSQDEVFATRFRREAIAASRIGHPSIVDVSDFGRMPDGRFYFVMELLEGKTLSRLVSASGAMAPQRVAVVTAQVARALGAAHGKGIIHRDLKPENVMVVPRPGQPDLVKVLDFGVAKDLTPAGQRATAAGMVVGTPQYMAPEQASGKAVDARSDIYALGLIAYELLAGQPPFQAQTPSAVMMKHVAEPPPPLPPGVPADLAELVLAMLRKDPQDRPATMDEVAGRLEAFARRAASRGQRTDLTPAHPEAPVDLAARPRRTGLIIAVVAAAVVAAAAAAWWLAG